MTRPEVSTSTRMEARSLARLEIFNFLEVRAVFVSAGKIVQKIFNREDAARSQIFGALGTNALDKLNRCLELKHDELTIEDCRLGSG